MGCAKGLCTIEKIFLFINIGFAMYSGSLLATAARLMWDPSTYTWFRFMCLTQYRVSVSYVFAAGLWLAFLVYLAAAAILPHSSYRHSLNSLHTYLCGLMVLVASEVAYGIWMVVSLIEWWRFSPQAELARRGIDLLHDIKPALLAVERYKDVAKPIYQMIEEVEHEAPNNVYVIIVFVILATALQVMAIVLGRKLVQRYRTRELTPSEKDVAVCGVGHGCEEDSDSGEGSAGKPSTGWRKTANLRMYTILDKIF